MNRTSARGLRSCAVAALALLAVTVSLAAQAVAQEWPNRPLRLVVGFPAGGSPDLVGRMIADKLSRRIGQPVVVENTVGGAGVLASDAIARSAPDGYAMVMLTGAHTGTGAMRKSLPYDPVNGFAMVSTVTAYPMMIITSPESPLRSLSDLIDRAKAAPGKITYASNAPGSAHHLLGEWINIEANTTMVPVPYRGAAQASVDLLGGRVDVMIDTATTAIELVRSGKARALAVASPERYPLLPDVPTVAETLPGVETMSWLGLAMAPGTPQPIVNRLNAELREILAEPEIKERLSQLGGVSNWSTPEQMKNQVAREIERWNRVIDQKKIERQ
jgi:tripartite-type tricarboxylate transporter receptor subunit TctC